MKRLYSPNILMMLLALSFSCNKEDELVGPVQKENQIYDISEVTFVFDSDHIYTTSIIKLTIDKPCDPTDAKFLIGDDEATLISYTDTSISIKVPDYKSDTLDLTLEYEGLNTTINKDLIVFKGNVSIEHLGDAPFEPRTTFEYFQINNLGYIFGGSTYVGCSGNGAQFEFYNNDWKINLATKEWSEVSGSDYSIFPSEDYCKSSNESVQIDDKYYFINKRSLENGNYAVNIDTFNNVFDTLGQVYSALFDNNFSLFYAFEYNKDIYFGIVRNEFLELWKYNTRENTHTLVNEKFSDYIYLDYFFQSETFVYFFNKGSFLSIACGEEVMLDNAFRIFQYNMLNNETREIALEDVPILSSFESPTFAYDNFGIIGEGPIASGNLIQYSPRYFKVSSK